MKKHIFCLCAGESETDRSMGLSSQTTKANKRAPGSAKNSPNTMMESAREDSGFTGLSFEPKINKHTNKYWVFGLFPVAKDHFC